MAKQNVSIQKEEEDTNNDEYYELYANQDARSLSRNPFSKDGDNTPSVKIPVGKMDYLHDIELELVVRFGQIKISLSDVMKIEKGSICVLQKYVGESVEIFIGDRIMARGEVVVVNERLGVRLSEVVRANDKGSSERNLV